MTRHLRWKSGWKSHPMTFLSSIASKATTRTKPTWKDRARNSLPSKPTRPTLPSSAVESLQTMSGATTSGLRRLRREGAELGRQGAELGRQGAHLIERRRSPRPPRPPRTAPIIEFHTHRHPADFVKSMKQLGVATGAGIAAMYFLDPDRGPARRAKVRDQLIHAQHEVEDGVDTLSRDLRNRATGIGAGARYRVAGRRGVDDAVLVERVRAKLGLVTAHPKAIDVSASDRRIRLGGDVLAEEHRGVVRAVARIPGVKSIDDQLRMHASADGVAALQGPPRSDRRSALLQENWSPTTRLAGGVAGVGLLGVGRRIGGLSGLLIRGGGLAMTARAAANKPLRRLTGIGAGPDAVEVEAAVTIDAPPEEIWPVISNYPSFPSFLPNVREVQRHPESTITRWTVRGPAHADVTFDAEETVREDGRRIGWRTLPGGTIAHAGEISLHGDNGRSHVQVRMTYNPVAGEIGHGVATLFGADAGHRLREDLQRLRDLIENSQDKQPAGAPA
jgi:uncharacterized membrane protein